MTIEALKKELFILPIAEQLEIAMEVMQRVKLEIPTAKSENDFVVPSEVMQRIEDIETGKTKVVTMEEVTRKINKKYGL